MISQTSKSNKFEMDRIRDFLHCRLGHSEGSGEDLLCKLYRIEFEVRSKATRIHWFAINNENSNSHYKSKFIREKYDPRAQWRYFNKQSLPFKLSRRVLDSSRNVCVLKVKINLIWLFEVDNKYFDIFKEVIKLICVVRNFIQKIEFVMDLRDWQIYY